MINLVTIDEAKGHLRIMNTDADVDINLKIQIASEIVMDYLKRKEAPEDWVTADSPVTYVVPKLIRGVTLLVLGELYMNREASVANVLPDKLCAILDRYRDPSFA